MVQGKTILKHTCQAAGKTYPEIKLYALFIDERPEEVTEPENCLSY